MGGWGEWSSESAFFTMSDTAFWSAATRYERKRAGSLSSWSREPPDRKLAPEDPIAKQGTLTDTGRGTDEGELAASPLVQMADPAHAHYQVRPGGWHVELGGQESIRGPRPADVSPHCRHLPRSMLFQRRLPLSATARISKVPLTA
jgi:hypothetical protein